MSAEPEIVVSDVPERKRFELTVDGELAGFLVYRARKGLLALIHTEVEDGYEGRGFGGRLARFALDRARDEGLAVLPFCPSSTTGSNATAITSTSSPPSTAPASNSEGGRRRPDVAFRRPAPTHS